MENYYKLKGLKILLFTKGNNFRIEGKVKEVDSKFIELYDEIKKKDRFINIDNIADVEVIGK